MRTKRYGAQTTRTGRMQNHIVAIVLADGEIFSNLLFTQALYDALKDKITPPDPLNPTDVIAKAEELIPILLEEDGVKREQLLTGSDLKEFLKSLRAQDPKALLERAHADSRAYYQTWIAKRTVEKTRKEKEEGKEGK